MSNRGYGYGYPAAEPTLMSCLYPICVPELGERSP